MTETNTQNAGTVNAGAKDAGAHTVTVKMSKLTEGIGILFSGILTMLEALDAGTAKTLTEGFSQTDVGIADTSATNEAPVKETLKEEARNGERTEGSGGSADPADSVPGNVTDVTSADHADAGTVEKKEAGKPAQTAQDATTAPGLTVDDVARIVVQKVKANPGINDKIRALVNAYGAQRVTELKPETFEAFLTDLSQL